MERLIDRNSNSENELEGFGDGKPLTSVDEFADDDVDDVEDDEFENEDKIIVFDVEKSARSVVGILKPVSFTMALVVWMVRLLHVITKDVEIGMVYHESGADSSGTRFVGSVGNALVFVGIVTVTTVLFVLLFKFRCMKILYGWLIGSTSLTLGAFGGAALWLIFSASNIALDYGTYAFVVWNFAVCGILAIFWRSPPMVNRAYLIAVSALMAFFFTFMPEWSTWCLLVAISLYDLAAVLLPYGPLRLLIEAAQQRQEHIPALLYNGMAEPGKEDEQQEEEERGVKLGLGDFVFYSVLLGRAALFDILTVFTCFVAILTGLFGTLILLAIFQKALPALPFSIALAMLFYFMTRFYLLPYFLFLAASNVLV